MKSTKELVDNLLSRIHSTDVLKEISDILEELSQDRNFKLHTNAIVSDSSLTQPQQRRQLSHLLSAVEEETLLKFFDDMLAKRQFWLFSTGKMDYFDNFTRQFQLATEELELVYLVTAIPLTQIDLEAIANDLTKSFGYKVVIKHETDSSILGGIQFRVESLVFDLSLRTKFNQFQRTWIASLSKAEKAIGRHQPN
jgi:F0F1-type ATP synthase delta subunit